MFLILLATLASSAAPVDGMVHIRGDHWARLMATDEPDLGEGHGPSAVSRQVRVRWDGDVAHVSARWQVRAQKGGWWRERLAGPGVLVERVTWNGKRAPTSSDASGTYVIGRVDGPVNIQLVGTLAGNPTRGATTLQLARASIGTLDLTAESLEGRVTATDAVPVDGHWWTSSDQLQVAFAPPRRAARDRRTLAVASSGVGLTVGEGELRGQARLQWRIRQGELRAVSFTAKHVGSDLDVTGSGVAGWDRQGDRVTVRLDQGVRDLVQLNLRWTSALSSSAEAKVQVPQIVPGDAFRVQSTLQLAKDSELEVVPDLKGWTAVSSTSLDTFGAGLIEGTPTAAYRLGGQAKSGNLSLLRFVPVPGPEVMVDVAAYTMTASAEGRTLTRALYTVRNERSGNLRFRPPADHAVIGMRVAGETAIPARTGDAWVIPLPRSVETVEGLVSFPVEVILLGRLDEGWSHREVRTLPLPQVGAPVAVNRVTLTLPPTWDDELEVGEHGRVDEFSEGEGIAYGFGVGGEQEAQADQMWQDAMGAYMSNDFDKADKLLDGLKDMGADNDNLGRLRSNLDVVQGRSGGGESAMSRRVVAQAWSRGEEDRREREQTLREAELELDAGNYEVAEKAYKKAEKLSNKLSKVEQKESVEERSKVQYSNDNAMKAKAKKVARDKDRKMYQAASEAAPEEEMNADVLSQTVVVASGDGLEGKSIGAKGFQFTGEDVSGAMDTPTSGAAIGGLIGEIGGHTNVADPDPSNDDDFDQDGFGGDFGEVLEVEDEEEPVDAPEAVELAVQPARIRISNEEVQRVSSVRALDAVVVSGRNSVRIPGLGGRGGSRNRRASKSLGPPPPAPPPPVVSPAPANIASPPMEALANGISDEKQLQDRRDGPGDMAAFEPLEVSSTSMSVVVPVLGQTIRYQHLLLPADAQVAVHVEARAPRTSTRSLK